MNRTLRRRALSGHRRASPLLLTGLLLAALLLAALLGCDQGADGLGSVGKPLVQVPVVVTGDIAPLLAEGVKQDDLRLRVALIWAAVPELDDFCIEYGSGLKLPDHASITAVVEAGCRDIFGFVPLQVAEGAYVREDGRATLDLKHLPSAEVLVGPPEGRVAYASVVVYDDRDDDETLELRQARRHFKPGEDNLFGPGKGPPEGGRGPGAFDESDEFLPVDHVYGGSFVSMVKPNVRLAFREGDAASAKYFYPMLGCAPPAVGFSTISVTGTWAKATCAASITSETEVSVALSVTPAVAELACTNPQTRFRDTEREADLSQPWHCVSSNQLVVANPPGLCKGLTIFLLSGCGASASCKEPNWDDRADPPDWWPCGTPTTEERKKGKK